MRVKGSPGLPAPANFESWMQTETFEGWWSSQIFAQILVLMGMSLIYCGIFSCKQSIYFIV